MSFIHKKPFLYGNTEGYSRIHNLSLITHNFLFLLNIRERFIKMLDSKTKCKPLRVNNN